VTDAACAAGLSPDRVAHLTLAFNEAVTNAIRHATGSALVAISGGRDSLTVQVTDEGSGIPASVDGRRSDPGPEAVSGRGLWLIRRLCDRVDIRTGSTGTCVRLVMLLAGAGGGGESSAV
jgi:anti-sigma regulatory factor (Ser/Thr protein kinase)